MDGFIGKGKQYMKVIKNFFSISEQKAYKIGDTYTGKKAKELAEYLEAPKKKAVKKEK